MLNGCMEIESVKTISGVLSVEYLSTFPSPDKLEITEMEIFCVI